MPTLQNNANSIQHFCAKSIIHRREITSTQRKGLKKRLTLKTLDSIYHKKVV